jgi:thiopurine S-methyltransferase
MTEDWLARWAEGRINFHEAQGNAGLQRYWQASGRRVLVPLCGKSQDLIWLARAGNAVVGVELAELAVRAFFDENELAAEQVSANCWRSTELDITLHCGDFFAFQDAPFDAHYDRGAAVALSPTQRIAYARKVNTLLSPQAYQLVITVEYEQSVIDGPPWSVPSAEILGYWPSLERVDARDDLDASPPRFREAGLTDVRAVVWRTPDT